MKEGDNGNAGSWWWRNFSCFRTVVMALPPSLTLYFPIVGLAIWTPALADGVLRLVCFQIDYGRL